MLKTYFAEPDATGVGVTGNIVAGPAVGVVLPAYIKLLVSVVVSVEATLLTRSANVTVPFGTLYRQGELLL